MIHRLTPRPWLALLSLGAVTALVASQALASSQASGNTLVGTFKLTQGSFTAGKPTGSYFRMIYPGGSLAAGKFFVNPDSISSSKTYTPVAPGTDGGLVSGAFQPSPTPAFDKKGSAKAKRIITPTPFTQIKFGLATLAKDPVSGASVPAPSIAVTNGKLSGQVQAVWAEWNNLYFNQGSPKPGGSRPGLTRPVSGTYDAKTGKFVLTWASSISGGPFNGFTGLWHLEGTFIAKK